MAVTYEGTADVHALVIGAAVTGIQAFRSAPPPPEAQGPIVVAPNA
jgi:hypothetical protein